ncbi:integrase, partial [Ralstonia solanacearum]
MGRKPSNPGAIPRFRTRRNTDGTLRYYYEHDAVDGKRKVEPLGTDRVKALQRWAELEGKRTPSPHRDVYTFSDVAKEYRKRELSSKAAETQRQYDIYLTRLTASMADKPVDEITPADVADIWQSTRDKRGTVTANRTKATLSAVLNCGRLWGMMKAPNPCTGVRGKKEAGRKAVLINDELYQSVYDVADQPLRNAMDLADLTSQRPG